MYSTTRVFFFVVRCTTQVCALEILQFPILVPILNILITKKLSKTQWHSRELLLPPLPPSASSRLCHWSAVKVIANKLLRRLSIRVANRQSLVPDCRISPSTIPHSEKRKLRTQYPCTTSWCLGPQRSGSVPLLKSPAPGPESTRLSVGPR